MDEVRVWNVARTELQIREDMGHKLTGAEPGLVSLWNFDAVTNGVVRDLGIGGHDGRLMGSAEVVTSATSLAGAEIQVALAGTVTDSFGAASANAVVTVRHNGMDLAVTRTDAAGAYHFILPELAGTNELSAVNNDEARGGVEIVLKPGQSSRVDLKLISPVRIRGGVVDTDGRAMAGVMVQLTKAESRKQKAETSTNSPSSAFTNEVVAIALSHADGSYHFRRVAAGRYVVRAQTANGFLAFDGGRAVDVKDDATLVGIDFRLPPRAPEVAGASNPWPTNQVFELKTNANGGWIALPDHIFDELDEATIEGWFKCEDFNNHYFYSYGGDQDNRMFIKNLSGNPTVTAAMDSRAARNLKVEQRGNLKSNEWCHVAWVTGKGGMRLYVNGVLAESQSYPGSFSALAPITLARAAARGVAAFTSTSGASGPRSVPSRKFATTCSGVCPGGSLGWPRSGISMIRRNRAAMPRRTDFMVRWNAAAASCRASCAMPFRASLPTKTAAR
jgi:hypothetical protein